MNTSPTWESARDAPAMRHELHFADRVVRCFVDRPPTISSLLADAVSRNRRGEDLVSDGVRLTWADVSERVERLALDLGARGVRPGERVVLLLGNGIEFPLALIATSGRSPCPSATAEVLQTLCAEQLSDYQGSRSFTLQAEPLPRNVNGKLLKRKLRERLLRESGS